MTEASVQKTSAQALEELASARADAVVTPAMLEAGLMTLRACDLSGDSPVAVVAAVYRAMAALAPPSSPLRRLPPI